MPLDLSSSQYKYSELAVSEDSSDSGGSKREKEFIERASTPYYGKPLPWIVSTVCLLLFNLALGLRLVALQQYGTYSTGFVTEFAPATSEINVAETRFSGTLAYTDSGRLYATTDPEGIRYVGKPTPEVDQAWEDLIGGIVVIHSQKVFLLANRNFEVEEAVQITRTEASQLAGNLHEDARDGFVAGPDVLHTLHCVNQIRMLFDSEHYFNTSINGLSRLARMHADHCLNHIRQSVQCHMDLTPHPGIYFESADVEVMDFDRVHTCRDMSKLREWVRRRREMKTVDSSKMEQGGGARNGPHRGYVSKEAQDLPWTW